MDDNILDCFDLIINYINKQLNHTLNNNIYTAFALHINTLIRRINNDKPIVNPNLSKIKKLYKKEFQIALGIREILENTLNISVSLEECGYLALFLVPEMKFSDSIDDMVKIIVIAHGESTASSMKDVVSKLLGEDCIIAIDAPIEISAAEILNKLRDIIIQLSGIKYDQLGFNSMNYHDAYEIIVMLLDYKFRGYDIYSYYISENGRMLYDIFDSDQNCYSGYYYSLIHGLLWLINK